MMQATFAKLPQRCHYRPVAVAVSVSVSASTTMSVSVSASASASAHATLKQLRCNSTLESLASRSSKNISSKAKKPSSSPSPSPSPSSSSRHCSSYSAQRWTHHERNNGNSSNRTTTTHMQQKMWGFGSIVAGCSMLGLHLGLDSDHVNKDVAKAEQASKDENNDTVKASSTASSSNSTSSSDNSDNSGKKIALDPNNFQHFPLMSTEKVTHNTKVYRFALPSEEHESGLTVASCVVARAEVDGNKVVRPYTPVSLNSQKGYMDLMIKTYPSPGGAMSRHIDSLRPGDKLELKGPFKKFEYKPNMRAKIGMIAGGTGITPMLQIIREVLSNPDDNTELHLIFANVTEEDILLREELDTLAYLYPQLKVYYTLDQPPKNWEGGVGFVNEQMVRDFLPSPDEDAMVLVCGPRGLMNLVSGPKGPKNTQGDLGGILNQLGYVSDQVYKF